MVVLIAIILLLPLMSFVVNPWLKSNEHNLPGVLATSLMFLCLSGTLWLWLKNPTIKIQFEWISLEAGSYALAEEFGIVLNPQMGLLLCLVALISFLVHLFSIEYMRHDPSQGRYFAYLGLFTFSMFGIIVSTSLVQLFLFWELVGLSSYLLIGFWYHKDAAAAAGKKAFIVNRVADSALLLGLIMLWVEFGSSDLSQINEFSNANGTTFWAGLLVLLGAMGKSAMFPFHVWLPDAMEGPTPVSALLHAATMVTAGIILIARLFPLFDPQVLDMMIFVGGLTALVGGYAALMQFDLKRVLAYSTISQLGFMMVALGAGTPGVALFHLLTHAFFKAGLFLSAGALIHSLHRSAVNNVQDMRNLGGVRSKMPLLFYAFVVFAAALVGLPLFSGFLSKDAVLEATAASHSIAANAGLTMLLVAILLTAMYMGRLIKLVFFGSDSGLPKVSLPGIQILIPLVILAMGSLWIGFGLNPVSTGSSWALTFLRGEQLPGHQIWIPLTSVVLVLVGLVLSWKLALSPGSGFFKLGANNFYLDKLYRITLVSTVLRLASVVDFTDRKILDGIIHTASKSYVVLAHITGFVDKYIVDGLVDGTAKVAVSFGGVLSGIQSGKIQSYILAALLGILILLWILVL